ncbi:tyrosine-type recombinase/integrase [Halomonas sp. MMSF_3323]|uniref:tyrosine-type recombinase/integrase n=1 Tax=Halomonas sp. MMSF_3323 TaxID=3046701 RepID=UPI00273EB897|nr:tyrosine-type recombinase/integrase [Halomonas sp. MMSF_3323]
MSDIRKRVGRNGTTYQVRYPSKSTKTGYAYATFKTRKEAQAFVESGKTQQASTAHQSEIKTVRQATEKWLRICEKEGLNGREPVTSYTLKNYEYRAQFIKAYEWDKEIQGLTAPDVVAFRSWLLQSDISRDLAGKVLSSFQSVMKEMTIRGVLPHNVAPGICIRADARYKEPVVVPTKQEVLALLGAADRLANAKNQTIANAWTRYRPMLYLAADSGMRPQEYLAISRSCLSDHGVQVERAIEGGGTKISVTKTPAARRFIELSPEVLDMVKHYADHHAPQSSHDLVFPASNGGLQSRRNWQRRGFNAACEEAGLVESVEIEGKIVEQPKYRPYDLRHFFASVLIDNKTNLKKIQTVMGHTNIETTLNVYGHLFPDEEIGKSEDRGMINGLLGNSCGKSVARNL